MVVADKKTEALKIVEEGIKELESAKGSVTVGVQKLSRVAKLLDDKEIYAWTELQLGSTPYINAIRDLAEKIDEEYEKEEKVIYWLFYRLSRFLRFLSSHEVLS